MTAYNSTDFEPSAPVAYVILQHQTTDASWPNVAMQIDSGADVTLIPEEAVARPGLTILSGIRYELVGFDNTISKAYAAELKLVFCRRTFRGKFLLVEQNMGIIGRDILNLIPLLLDGPRLEWSEYRPNV